MGGSAFEQDFEAAVRQQGEGDLQAAEASYRRVLAAAPALPEAHCNLGVVLLGQGRRDEAIACFLRALKGKRKGWRIYANLATALKELGWIEEATACYRRAGELRRQAGDAAGSLGAYEAALALSPKDFSTRFHMGAALIRLNRYAEAARCLGQAKAQVDDLALFADFMARGEASAVVQIEGRTLRFCVSKLTSNFGVDMRHIKGGLYEEEELRYCRQFVKPGAVIVDVGANTGNHLVFFAMLLEPALIIPVEPHPGAIEQLRRNIALNAIPCVDERCLGYGAGRARARFRLAEGVDWAQAALAPAADGAVEVAPLDELIDRPVDFIKIDVEGMEIDVLEGARGLLSRNRPRVMIEVSDRNAEAFHRIARELGYAVSMKFARDGYTNYFLVSR